MAITPKLTASPGPPGHPIKPASGEQLWEKGLDGNITEQSIKGIPGLGNHRKPFRGEIIA